MHYSSKAVPFLVGPSSHVIPKIEGQKEDRAQLIIIGGNARRAAAISTRGE